MVAGEGVITPEMLQRRLIFDAMGDPVSACRLAGLMATGEDGNRAEEAASDLRLMKIAPVMPVIVEMASYLAGLATTTQLSNQETVPDGFAEEMFAMYKTVISSSVVSVISVLNDLGMLSVRAA